MDMLSANLLFMETRERTAQIIFFPGACRRPGKDQEFVLLATIVNRLVSRLSKSPRESRDSREWGGDGRDMERAVPASAAPRTGSDGSLPKGPTTGLEGTAAGQVFREDRPFGPVDRASAETDWKAFMG